MVGLEGLFIMSAKFVLLLRHKYISMDILELEKRVERLESRVSLLDGGTVQKHVAAPPVVVEVAAPKMERESENIVESFIGGRVLLRVGIVAILAAVGFFLKYAFDQELLSDFFKVIVIALSGGGMIALGSYLAKKHQLFGHVIVGGGIAVWFFDVIAAHTLYGFISPLAALILTLILTVVMLAFSVKHESHPLLIASLSGAYLAPVFFGNSEVTVSVQNGFALYSLIVTAAAFWFLQRKREWMMYFLFPIIGFGGHLVNWALNDFPFGMGAFAIGAEAAIALFFIFKFWVKSEIVDDGIAALFAVQSIISAILMLLQGNLSEVEYDRPLMYVWFAACILAGLWWLYSKRREFIPVGLLGNTAMIFLMFSTVSYFSELKMVYVLLLIAIFGATSAALIQKVSIQIGAFLLSFQAFAMFMESSKSFTLGFDASIWFNEITLLFALLIAVFAFQAWLSQFHKNVLAKSVGVIAGAFAQITGLVFMSRQIDLAMDPSQKKEITYSIGLILYGVANLVFGFIKKSQVFRLTGLIVLGIAISKVAFVDLWGLGTLYRIAVSLVLGILLISSSFLYHKFSDALLKR